MKILLCPVLALALLSPAHAQEILFDVTGTTADSYGQVCEIVGDMDGDGLAEFMVGAWRHDPGGLNDAGAVFVYAGADGSLCMTIPGTGANDHMGFGSSAAGDVDGDGFADVCAAADEDDVPGPGGNAGSATIVSGFDGSTIHTLTGDSGGDLFGWSTAAAGDVDGDGFVDVLVSSLLDEGGGSPNNAGSMKVFSGDTGALIHAVYGDVANGSLGADVGRAGDVDNDGFADFIGTRGSLAKVFSGDTGLELYSKDNPGGGSNGIRVSGGVDVDLDGHDDFIVGASTASSNMGRVRVYSGDDGSVLHEWFGDAGDRLGRDVVGAGDIDGDGHGDVVAGAPQDDDNGTASGALWAFSGKTGDVISIVAGQMDWRIGTGTGGMGDVNGDGVPDAAASSINQARAVAASFVPTGLTPFGTGTPGCDGTQPLLANSSPFSGNTGFKLLTSHANTGMPALLAISDTADVPGTLIAGVIAHVDPGGGLFLLVDVAAPDSNGSLEIPLAVPSTGALIGQSFTAQVATTWPGGSCVNLSTSRGLTMEIQP